MKFNANNRNLMITLLLCGSAVAYVFFLFLPTQRSIALLQTQLTEQQNTVSQGQMLTDSLATLNQELAAALAFAEEWKKTSPHAGHRAPALGAVTRCAAEAGVRTLQFDPQPTQPLATVSRIPIQLTCQGTFAQVYDLLGRLEALPATIWMDEARIRSLRQGGEIVECELTLVVFADNHDSSS